MAFLLTVIPEHYASDGIDAVRSLKIDRQINRGCSQHPSGLEHAQIAGTEAWTGHEQIIPFVSELMAW
jgi:hypothetical protein